MGSLKENQSKLNEFVSFIFLTIIKFLSLNFLIKLNRTVTNLPLQSSLGQLKINLAAKASAIMSYKQQHLQQIQMQTVNANQPRKVRKYN